MHKTIYLSIFSLFFSFSTISAIACSCDYIPFGIERIIESSLLLDGEIIDKTYVNFEGDKDRVVDEKEGDYFRYTLNVGETIKGENQDSIIYFYSSIYSTACGVDYAIGTKIYVFLNNSRNKLFTNSCAGNIKYPISKQVKSIVEQYKNSSSSQVWFNEKKELVAKGKIANKTPVGKWKFFFRNGGFSHKGRFKNGLKEGKWKFYQESKSIPYRPKSNEEHKHVKQLKSIVYYKKGKAVQTK